jgi:hypothetical protein
MPVFAIAAAALIAGSIAADTMTPLQREMAMWDMVKEKRMDAFASMLMPGFVGIGSHGVVDRTGEIEGVRQGHLLGYKLSNVRIAKIDADDLLLTYVADLTGQESGKPAPVRIQVATLWHRSAGKWLMAYHSGFGVHRGHEAPGTATSACAPGAGQRAKGQ